MMTEELDDLLVDLAYAKASEEKAANYVRRAELELEDAKIDHRLGLRHVEIIEGRVNELLEEKGETDG